MQSIASHEVEQFFNQISLLVAPQMLKHLIQTGVGIQFGTSCTGTATLKHS
jgi:hypothetical protein